MTWYVVMVMLVIVWGIGRGLDRIQSQPEPQSCPPTAEAQQSTIEANPLIIQQQQEVLARSLKMLGISGALTVAPTTNALTDKERRREVYRVWQQNAASIQELYLRETNHRRSLAMIG